MGIALNVLFPGLLIAGGLWVVIRSVQELATMLRSGVVAGAEINGRPVQRSERPFRYWANVGFLAFFQIPVAAVCVVAGIRFYFWVWRGQI